MTTRSEWAERPRRESLGKRLGPRRVAALWARDGHACAYCHAALVPGVEAHLDHLTPRVRGGADAPGNLVLACRRCNSARQDRGLAEWSRYARAVFGLTIDPAAIRRQARRALAPRAA